MGNKASIKNKGHIEVKPHIGENPEAHSFPDVPVHKPTEGGVGPTIQDLPSEVLDYIFSFLTIKERIRTEWVCRSWAEFGKNYKWSWPIKLTNEMLLHNSKTITDDVLLSVMSRCGTSLKKLEMIVKFREHLTSTKVFDVIGSNCPNLTEIKLGLWKRPRKRENRQWSLINVTKGCPKLKAISLCQWCCWGNDYANVCLALKECRSLEYLELSSDFVDEGCLHVIEVPLKGFNLWAYSGNSQFAHFAESLICRNDPIEQLGFLGLRDEYHAWLLKVFRHYEKTLKVLTLQRCQISSRKMCAIPFVLKNVEVLSMKYSHLVDDEVMNILAANCTKLWALNVSNTQVTDVGISALAALPNLTCLDVSLTFNVSWKGLLKLASNGRLEMFYFAGIQDYEEGHLIAESSMQLVNCSPNLRFIDLRFNITVTQRLVDEIRCAVQSGVIKGPLKLLLSSDQVSSQIKGCDRLQFIFDTRPVVRNHGKGAPWQVLPMANVVVPKVEPPAGRISLWGAEALNGWGAQ